MNYKVVATSKDTKARAGVIGTDHGEIQTPIFMPVGTVGANNEKPLQPWHMQGNIGGERPFRRA